MGQAQLPETQSPPPVWKESTVAYKEDKQLGTLKKETNQPPKKGRKL